MANFQFISKNNIGVVVVLLLVILVSQSKVFNILLDTVLGRIILIAFLLIISYLNKILGIVSVLIIVIVFNNSSIGYMEGFTTDASNNVTSHIDSSNNVRPPTDASNNVTPPTPPANASPKHPTPPANVSTTATEGFDIIGKESIIKRGKQSNSIPVTDFMRESTSAAPYEGSSYLESFSAF